jgi:hypothetical protein
MSTIRLCGNDIDGNACAGFSTRHFFETIAQTDSLLDRVWHAPTWTLVSPPRRQRDPGHWRDRSRGRLDHLIRNRPQVDFGVFVRLPASIGPESLGEHVSAEGAFRKRSKDSQIKVVAFDSAFIEYRAAIEVTTDIEDILENLRDRFGGSVVVE